MSEFDLVEMTDATLPLVQHLRYRVYCAEKQFAMAGADHESRLLRGHTIGRDVRPRPAYRGRR